MEDSDFDNGDQWRCPRCRAFVTDAAIGHLSRVVALGSNHDPTLYQLCAEDQWQDLHQRRTDALIFGQCLCTDLERIIAGIIDFSTLDQSASPYDPDFIAELTFLWDIEQDFDASMDRVIAESPAMVAKSAIDWWDAQRGEADE